MFTIPIANYVKEPPQQLSRKSGAKRRAIMRAVPIIAAIDVAALIGSIDWLVRDKLGLVKSGSGT